MSRTRARKEVQRIRISNTTESIKTENSDQNLIYLPFHASHCIFCASECSAKFGVHDGKVTRIKNEKELSVIERQLKSLFIAQNILGVKEKTCHELLNQFDGQLNPEHWINICLQCNGFVEIYRKNLMEIARLVKEADHIKLWLKRAIWESNQENYVNEKEDGAFLGVWKEIREQAVIDFDPSQARQQEQTALKYKSIVKVERDDNLLCTISLILVISLFVWDTNKETSTSFGKPPQSPPPPPSNTCVSFPKKTQQRRERHQNPKSKRKIFCRKKRKKTTKEGGNLIKCRSCLTRKHCSQKNGEPGVLCLCQFCGGCYVRKYILYSRQQSSKYLKLRKTSESRREPETAKEDVNDIRDTEPEGNSSPITENEERQVDQVAITRDVQENELGSIPNSPNMEHDDDFCEVVFEKQNQPENEVKMQPTYLKETFTSIYTRLYKKALNKPNPVTKGVETTVKAGRPGVQRSSTTEKRDDNPRTTVPIVVFKKQNQLENELRVQQTINKMLSSIYAELHKKAPNKLKPATTGLETTVVIGTGTGAQKSNTTKKRDDGVPLTAVPIVVSRTNGNIIISRNPDLFPAVEAAPIASSIPPPCLQSPDIYQPNEFQ